MLVALNSAQWKVLLLPICRIKFRRSKEERFHRLCNYNKKFPLLAYKQNRQTVQVIIDDIDEEGIIGRSMADAPEIDGVVYGR